MSADATIEQVNAREIERVSEALDRAMGRGGLPKLEARDDFGTSFQFVHDMLEEFTQAAEAVDGAYNYGIDLPLAVTTEHVAAVALIVEETNRQVAALLGLNARLTRTVPFLGDLIKK